MICRMAGTIRQAGFSRQRSYLPVFYSYSHLAKSYFARVLGIFTLNSPTRVPAKIVLGRYLFRHLRT